MGRHLETGIFHFQQVALDRIDQIFKPLAVNSDPSLNSKAPPSQRRDQPKRQGSKQARC